MFRFQLCVFAILLLRTSVSGEEIETRSATSIRFATFNIQELSFQKLNQVDGDGRGANPQLLNCVEILQTVRPDIVLINEIDAPSSADDLDSTNPAGNAAEMFLERYLGISREGHLPLKYPHVYIAASNTGVPTGMDLNNDGKTDGPADCFGFGRYPGEYGMALLSRYPIQTDEIRTFRKLLWKEMPGHLMPDGSGDRPAFYSAEERRLFRLSSKSHWDVPLLIGGQIVHALCSHPTPPVFDGPEDSNGRRNFDEVRFWANYLTGGSQAEWIRDDTGRPGGLPADEHFVVLGDLNAEPTRGDAVYGQRAIELLLKHPRVFDPRPMSAGGAEQPSKPGLADYLPFKTSEFGRLDYVLPSRSLNTIGSGVFWPTSKSSRASLVATPQSSSDHRLVWADVEIP